MPQRPADGSSRYDRVRATAYVRFLAMASTDKALVAYNSSDSSSADESDDGVQVTRQAYSWCCCWGCCNESPHRPTGHNELLFQTSPYATAADEGEGEKRRTAAEGH